jgi:cation diffusion facilitator family transporter
MDINQQKKFTAGLSVASNTILVVGKLIIGIIIGSVSVISEAVHSGMDLVAAVIAYFAVREAGKPPDKLHPFGHGKAESISGAFEGLLIFIAIIIIAYQAIHKLIIGSEVVSLNLGLFIMAISAILNTIVSRQLFKVAKKSESLALEADALHLSTDILTSAGVFFGLLLIRITGFNILDPIIALCVAIVIGRAAYDIIKRSVKDLMDESISDVELSIIRDILNTHRSLFIDFHDLRSRKTGNIREIDLHLVQSKEISLDEAHKVCDHIEEELKAKIPRVHITIHVEPFEDDIDKGLISTSFIQGNIFSHIFRHRQGEKLEN